MGVDFRLMRRTPSTSSDIDEEELSEWVPAERPGNSEVKGFAPFEVAPGFGISRGFLF